MIRTQVLWMLDRVFPPLTEAFMDGDRQTAHEETKAPDSMGRYLAELPDPHVDVLDFGCGWGGETLWLARRVRSVIGADVDRSSLEQAARALERSGVTNCRFVEGTASIASASVDAVFSTDTFEHVTDLPGIFRELYRVLRPGGMVVSRWGPLFYSPFGYHLRWACQVPYAHVIGGLKAVTALRNARAPQPLHAATWEDLGLNGRVFEDYRAAAEAAGFSLTRFNPIPVMGQTWLTRLPWMNRFFIFGIDARLDKPAGPARL